MLCTNYKRPAVAWGKVPVKSRTIPDQTMSIKELVRRFVKGIPADVSQKQPVYVDQSDHDLERMSRMDSADKAYEAVVMRAENERVEAELVESERRVQEERAIAKAEAEAASRASSSSGIVSLDNTMPVDTGLISKQLPVQRK